MIISQSQLKQTLCKYTYFCNCNHYYYNTIYYISCLILYYTYFCFTLILKYTSNAHGVIRRKCKYIMYTHSIACCKTNYLITNLV